jgi:hypothetical protein
MASGGQREASSAAIVEATGVEAAIVEAATVEIVEFDFDDTKQAQAEIGDVAESLTRHHVPVTSKMTAYASESPDAAPVRAAQ